MKYTASIMAAAVALAGVTFATPSMAECKSGKCIRIGHINTFSGGAAVFGKHQRDGVEIALKHLGGKIGGYEVEMFWGDDQRKPDVGRQVADKMVKKDKVHFVTGITWSNILAAVQKTVVRSKTVLISTNAGPTERTSRASKTCSKRIVEPGPPALATALTKETWVEFPAPSGSVLGYQNGIRMGPGTGSRLSYRIRTTRRHGTST